MGKILVTGGAGYIGSHAVKALLQEGLEPLVLDDLSEGHREAVPDVEFVEGDCRDREVLDRILSGGAVTAALHFAARCYVGESVDAPRRYYSRNLTGALTLLDALVDHDVGHVIFSSSCAVYGDPGRDDLEEERSRNPVSPYGRTKAAVEWALEDYAAAYGLSHVALRYFNAAGADPDGDLGEDHEPESHLVPLVIREALRGEGRLVVFGDDYPTPDGTCVRDYVHVADLAAAHVSALSHLVSGGDSARVNLGTGRGYSVLDVVTAVRERAGRDIEFRMAGRRPGDPARLVARPGRAGELLGWMPVQSDLETIVDTAYRWHESHPEGYR